jgi:hypothetical protein
LFSVEQNDGKTPYAVTTNDVRVDAFWLIIPINRDDMDLDIIMRLYAPDLERYESWTPPKTKKLASK